MPVKFGNRKKFMLACIVLTATLCFAQIKATSFLILSVLGGYLFLVSWAATHSFAMPILLFFLPWSPLMRISPESFSFYTFGLILICGISLVSRSSHFKRYHITIGIILLFITLIAKLVNGFGISFDYLAFIMMILLFPVAKQEISNQQYKFYELVLFFSVGIILGAFCAQYFASSYNIAKFIRVDEYSTITRRSGFYGDPNFYTAQITAALSGCLVLILKETNKRRITTLIINSLFLVYCGFLSGSKSFALVAGCMLITWLMKLFRLKGRAALKVVLLAVLVFASLYIATSALFTDLINVLITRFSHSSTLSDFTTHRTELWASYLKEMFSNWKTMLIGNGFTNIKVNDRGSHNTLIQLIWQFGVLGAPLILVWAIYFLKDVASSTAIDHIKTSGILILAIGTYLPWLAIDILFFDEFFLLQMYMCLGIKESEQTESSENVQKGQKKTISTEEKYE